MSDPQNGDSLSLPSTAKRTLISRSPLAHMHSSIGSTNNSVDPDRLYISKELIDDERRHDALSPSPTSATAVFTLGTRKSQLALVQTHLVADALTLAHTRALSSKMPGTDTDSGSGLAGGNVQFKVESMTTVGDKNQTTPLHLLTPYSQQQPAKSLWTDELEARLMSGHFDLLVHSLKDVPTTLKDGCEIGAILTREDPRDCLVVKAGRSERTLEDLETGSVVGTGSVRRVAQLKRAFPGLRFEDMRGNLNTRLAKLDNPSSPFAALILATSGLTRINMGHRITSPISSPHLYHAVGQGALGLEIRTHDRRTRECLRSVGHWQTEWRCGAERGCLRVLEGGCSVPVGIETVLEELSDDYQPTSEEDLLTDEVFPPIIPSSPMLWFSGLLDPTIPLPSPSSPMPPLSQRSARLTIRACVTSLDGSQQVVHTPPGVVVRSYQEAERWGEICAGEVKYGGGKEILDEVGRIRRERERGDLERAIEKSRRDASLAGNGNGDKVGGEGEGEEGEHVGLQGLVRVLEPDEARG